jgi:CheY-like chemotaxis protein
MTPQRAPLIIVASAVDGVADEIARRLRSTGAVAYPTHSAAGCLRVATSARPDVVLLDASLPSRLEQLLKAHPVSANARLLHLSDSASVVAQLELDPPRRTPIAAA